MCVKKTNALIDQHVLKSDVKAWRKKNKAAKHVAKAQTKLGPVDLASATRARKQATLGTLDINVASKKNGIGKTREPPFVLLKAQEAVVINNEILEVSKGIERLGLCSQVPNLSSLNNAALVAHQGVGTSSLVELPIRRRVLRRFYEPILILHALDPCRGKRIKDFSKQKSTTPDTLQLRRSFLTYLAYICDYEKGGDTCSSIVLEQCAEKIRYWVAANCSVKPKTIRFLKGTLTDLAKLTADTSAETEAKALSSVVAFCTSRITVYVNFVKKYLSACIKRLDQMNEDTGDGVRVGELLSTLKYLHAKFRTSEHLNITLICHGLRSGNFFSDMTSHSQDSISVCPIKIVRHNVGRLGEYPKAAKILIQAALQLPRLFRSYEVVPLQSAPVTKISLIEKQTTLECLSNRFSSDPTISNNLLEHLSHFDRWSNLSARLQENCSTSTRIHAELYLVQLFHKHRLRFVDNDKFVGCSKPACYLCYEYILALDAGFSLPPSHNKMYVAWKPPSVLFGTTEEEKGKEEKEMEDVLNRMTKRVRGHVLEQIQGKMERKSAHPDSTTGVSSAVVGRKELQLGVAYVFEEGGVFKL